MHIRESDTPFDDIDHDDLLGADADEIIHRYLKQSDLDALNSNCSEHISIGVRISNEAAELAH